MIWKSISKNVKWGTLETNTVIIDIYVITNYNENSCKQEVHHETMSDAAGAHVCKRAPPIPIETDL